MNFNFHMHEDLPKLSWCLKMEKDHSQIEVSHGKWVEANDRFFAEGAWDGDFGEGHLDRAETVMGSGAKINGNGLVICTPSHTTECLYSIKNKNTLWFSNSLAFVLEASRSSLDINYLDYENDILSISDGLKKYRTHLPLSDGSTVHLHYFVNLSVNQDLDVTRTPKPLPPSFSNYHEYKGYLSTVLKTLALNAASPERSVCYPPIVFSSNGYDSVACAALGREIGCTEAVVFESKRRYRSDSGKEAVLALDYETIHEKHEIDYKKTDCAEEFVATGELGTSIFFAAAEKELAGKFLLSGVHGDKIWDRNCQTVGDDISRSFFPDTAKTEFRLRTGYLQIAVPFIGVLNHRQIHQISNSAEMDPWSIREEYDRPIPRRIAEEKGVPREAFGIEKVGGAGSSLRFLSLLYLKKVMPLKNFEDFSQYYQAKKSQRKKSLHYLVRSTIYFIYCLTVFLNKMHFTYFEHILQVHRWHRKYTCSPWAPSFLLHWGVEKVGRRYRKGIKDLKLE